MHKPFSLLLIAVVVFCSAAPVSATQALSEEVEQLSRARYEALNNKNLSFVDKSYAQDYEFVSYWGQRYGRDFLKSWIASGSSFRLTPSNYKVVISDAGTMAFAVLDLHEEYGSGDDIKVVETVFTEIYARQDDGWILVQAHNSVKSKAPWEA